MNYSLHNGRRTEWFLEVFQITAHCRPVFQPIFYHVYVMLGQIKKKEKYLMILVYGAAKLTQNYFFFLDLQLV